ncbi:hypothetical protein BIY22_16060 [Vibrio panuliri]|uniref:Uncharacterized protein n=1 Tax=Vibrio panuliri TaxID=1381081 RepID=A0A1Q9HND2_9VIBR|nr:hypothetical protein BIY22_16060 [Vibrio panuliri]
MFVTIRLIKPYIQLFIFTKNVDLVIIITKPQRKFLSLTFICLASIFPYEKSQQVLKCQLPFLRNFRSWVATKKGQYPK